MGIMTFQLPAGLTQEAAGELERSSLVGGPDNMPWHCAVAIRQGVLQINRTVEDSGYLAAPWTIQHAGQFIGQSATLMERATPYRFLVELARGKVNQIRTQTSEWQAGGLVVPAELERAISEASLAFGQVVCAGDPAEEDRLAQITLERAYQEAHRLVETYQEQVFTLRHQRQPRLDTVLSCLVGPSVFDPAAGQHLLAACNKVCIPLSWHLVEADETSYRWDAVDRLLEWAEKNDLDVSAGPLINFSSSQLPPWLWLWENDVPSMATFMCRFVEAAVRRYRSRIRRWQLTAASNWADLLHLSEEELLALTFRLGETARQVDPTLELIVGISQPWGEYMVPAEREWSPFIFADNLIRSGLALAGLDLEVVMGVGRRGSYCRDLLEFVRLLELYTLLGVPLRLTLGYPAAASLDPDADPEVTVGAGQWRDGFAPATQADWARSFLSVALCRPSVQEVQWVQFSDSDPHLFPHCGLLDHQRQPRPVLQALTELRQEHLL
jgi:hypothetical protein